MTTLSNTVERLVGEGFTANFGVVGLPISGKACRSKVRTTRGGLTTFARCPLAFASCPSSLS